MIAVISSAGVTSKAGFQIGESDGAVCRPATPRTSAASRSSMAMAAPLSIATSMVDQGAATENGVP